MNTMSTQKTSLRMGQTSFLKTTNRCSNITPISSYTRAKIRGIPTWNYMEFQRTQMTSYAALRCLAFSSGNSLSNGCKRTQQNGRTSFWISHQYRWVKEMPGLYSDSTPCRGLNTFAFKEVVRRCCDFMLWLHGRMLVKIGHSPKRTEVRWRGTRLSKCIKKTRVSHISKPGFKHTGAMWTP